MAAVLITVFLTCRSFDKVNAMVYVSDQKGFTIDILKRIDALEKENLQLKTKIGEMKQIMDMQLNETQNLSDSFDIIKDEVQELLPKSLKSSFGNATFKVQIFLEGHKIKKTSPKGFSASKWDVGNWIYFISKEFFHFQFSYLIILLSNFYFILFLVLSGTNDNDRKLFKVSCEGSCKGVNILLDYSMSDGDPDLCARYFFSIRIL